VEKDTNFDCIASAATEESIIRDIGQPTPTPEPEPEPETTTLRVLQRDNWC
jgi:hypothetical protein